MTKHMPKRSECGWGPALAVLSLLPETALANNIPGPQTSLGFIAMLIAIPVLTYFGGGEKILARLKPASRLKRGFVGLLKVLAVLIGIVWISTEGTAGGALLGALAFAVFRGSRLVTWGVKAGLPEGARPAHVEGVSRWRLISGGSLLIVGAVALTHMSIAFLPQYPPEHQIARDLMRLTLAVKEAGKENKGGDGLPRYTAPSVSDSGSYQVAKEWYHALKPEQNAFQSHFWHATEVKIASDGKSFQAWAWPRVVPYWPWNHVMPVASYYIDQTGQLRIIRVAEPGMRCPQDAPVRAIAEN